MAADSRVQVKVQVKVRVGLGIATNPFSSARAFFRFVDLCEESGIDSLWQTDRLASTQPFLEAMSTMAALAGASERLKFGMNAVVVSLRDPLLLAKQCATIDYLSGGRLLPVFGVGGNQAPEWNATGQSPKGRGARADEALTLMQRLWAEDKVSFEGDHYRYTDASISPRPVQQPLPCWIGGSSPAAIRRTARLGTGWLAGIQTPDQVAPVIQAIRKASRDAGRPIPEDHYGAGFPFRFGNPDDPLIRRFAMTARAGEGYAACGDARAVLDRIDEYRAAGASKFVLIPIASGDEDLMEQARQLIEEVLPQAHALSTEEEASVPG
jgi:probable F420-dependent oxidoreductase